MCARYCPVLLGGGREGRNKKRGPKRQMPRRNMQYRPRPRALNLQGGSGLIPSIKPRREYFRYVVNISTNAAGKFAVYGCMNNPSQAVNGSGTYDRAKPIALLYDLYQPVSLKAEMVLQAPIIAATGRIGFTLDADSLATASPTYDILEDTAFFEERTIS